MSTAVLSRPLAPCLLLLVVLSGCSRNPYDGDVSGVVSLDGQTIGPGVVVFAPASLDQNPSRGNIDNHGRYYMITKHSRGLHPGKYKVAVQVYDTSTPLAPGERLMEQPEPVVPEKYLSPTTSGLEREVVAGKNSIDIALSSE